MSPVDDELRAKAEADGVEFFFAMFVDMHGKPCAKMIPVEALEVLTGGGAVFVGFAAGPLAQGPAGPGMIAMLDPHSSPPIAGTRTASSSRTSSPRTA